MNEQDIHTEETAEETETINIEDERRFADQGEPVDRNAKNAPPPPVKSMRETDLENKLKEETARREAAEAKLVGVQAKFEEVRAQMERETQEMRERMRKTLEDRAKQGQFNFLTTLLPVLDNLKLAVDHAERDTSFEHLLEGVRGTARSFEQALGSVGVEPVAAVGEEFDPERHEAVDMVETDAENDGRVTSEYSRGYRFGERLLRPARVQVGKARAQSAGE